MADLLRHAGANRVSADVGNSGYAGARARGRRWRRAAIVLALGLALLLIFHRPILFAAGRLIVRHYAAKENLRVEFRVEGNIFSHLTIRNLHVVPIGPTDVESIDADLVRADYSLLGLLRRGWPGFFKNVELHSARIDLNPARAPPKQPEKRQKKAALPGFFPERVRIVDSTLVVRNTPHDFFVQHVDLELDPRHPGELRIGRLQLPPGQSWRGISGTTSYSGRDFVLRDLVLNEQERIDLLNIDASAIGQDQLSVKLEATIGDGKLSGSGEWIQRRRDLSQTIKLSAQNIPADALNKYANLPEQFLGGRIERADVDFAGQLRSPRSWQATISANWVAVRVGAIEFDRCALSGWVKEGKAVLESADLVQRENHISARGRAQLSERIEDLWRSQAVVEFSGSALDLEQLTAGTRAPVTGSAQLNAKIDMAGGKVEATVLASAASVTFQDGTIDRILANVRATKVVSPPDGRPRSTPPAKEWFTDLQTTLQLDVSDMRYRDYIVDSLKASAKTSGDQFELEHLTAQRLQNNLSVRGHGTLPRDLRNLAAADANVDVVLHASELGDYWTADAPDKIKGRVQLEAHVRWKDETANGRMSITGSDLRIRGVLVTQLKAQGAISDNVIQFDNFAANLNENDFIKGRGTLNLFSPFNYSGELSARISNLATLEPLLRAVGNENEMAGSLVIDWQGEGEAKTFKNSGSLKLALRDGRYGGLHRLRTNIDATYSPEGLEIPLIFFSSDKMDFQMVAEAKGERLEISKIELNQAKAKYASGYISFPFVWKNLGTKAPVLPRDGQVVATVQSENIDIKRFFEDMGIEAQLAGTLSVKLDAQGTLGDLNARLDAQIRDLRTARAPKFEPARFDLTAQIEHNELHVNGKLQQTRIQPLELTAEMPFDVPKIVADREIDDATPVTARIRLPRSSVNFIRQFAPDIATLDGNLALDVDVSGTFGRPVLRGSADMNVNVGRFTHETLPALGDFRARLVFANDALTLEQFGGALAGGRFTVTGRVTFPSLTSANLDLRLRANSVLLARDDTMTIRADSDLQIAGPLTSAKVKGNLALTNSRFLKNIDLIPIGLPGRPAPRPPAAEPEFSIPDPPFRDWEFDVAITTKDPVLIRGNLATGGATSDLRLTGTGLRPGLSGIVRLRNVDATLPFSRLSISQGALYFDPSDSFNPRIDLHGSSVIQDYTVRVYVYGTLLAPQAVFSSEPPLPQEEIISLLATGTTREQLIGSGNVLAGRAAMLLVQQLYVKIFKKGEATQPNPLFDRLDLDLGQIDPRTGQRQAIARIRVTDQLVLVGNVEVGGDFRGMVKYLIRFR